MNRKMLLGGIAAFGLSLLIPASGIAANTADIIGQYKCEGTNADGRTYKGKVAISKQGNAYYLRWVVGKNQNFTGVGVLEGNVLAVSYYGSFTGVVAYRVEDSSRLVGKWTTPTAKGQVSTEVLTK
ncbi:hypothetical protein [Calothrix sp. PCC 7507]|uniref:hypothetical protein n=1 Tax=Calothrix sp. PCC 7507 TaxID=99598 RepID=UPI00029EE700|nr:hypothetical protein [Calothrix sp. PCC 7507]AFY36004.1 protein kinase [Calothrix sp. PCC 7507]